MPRRQTKTWCWSYEHEKKTLNMRTFLLLERDFELWGKNLLLPCSGKWKLSYSHCKFTDLTLTIADAFFSISCILANFSAWKCHYWHWQWVLVSKKGNCGLFFKEEIMVQLTECESIQDCIKEDIKLQDKELQVLQKEKELECRPARKTQGKKYIYIYIFNLQIKGNWK